MESADLQTIAFFGLIVALVPGALISGLYLVSKPTAWVTVFFGIATLCPPLPIALGNSGPHPAIAVAFAGLVAGIARAREWRPAVTAVNGSILLLTAAMLFSVGWAAIYSGPAIATGSLARVALFAIGVYVFFYTVAGPRETQGQQAFHRVRIFFWFATLAALFACVDFYYQFPAPAGFGPQFVWLDTGVLRRAQGFFYEASTLGNFCACFLIMIAVSFFRPGAQRPVPTWEMGIGGILLAAAVVLSYSRASVVSILVGFAALAFLRKRRVSIWRPIVIGAACLAVTSAVCYLVVPVLFQAYLFRLQNSVTFSLSGVLSGRVESWISILRFLAEHPWQLIGGVGYKTLPYSDYTGVPVIADNTYLSILAETGLPGLAALLFFLVSVLRLGYRASQDPDSERSFFGAWTFCFWCGQAVQMLSGDLLTYWRVLPIYFWVIARAAR